MGPGFRFATDTELDALVALVESAYRGERAAATWTSEAELIGGQRVDHDMVEAAVAGPTTSVLVLGGDGGSIVACCELSRPGANGRAGLGMFAVDPAHQSGGLGGRVLTEAERVAGEDWGAVRLELLVIDVRHELIDWYRTRGYHPTGERRPFPYGDERYGIPRRDDLRFAVLSKDLGRPGPGRGT